MRPRFSAMLALLLAAVALAAPLALAVAPALAAPTLALPLPPDGDRAPVVADAAPEAAPEAPWVEIAFAANPAHVLLFWDHLIENEYYEVYRSPVPYFEPGVAPANRIADIDAAGYGSGSVVELVDDGIDRYAADGEVGPVQVIGDVAHNHFWAVQARAEGSGSGVLNYVGEFDFALTPGG